MFSQRPHAGETDDDLLRQQQEFFKDKGVKNRKINTENDKSALGKNIFGVIGDVVEKKPNVDFSVIKSSQTKGFPRAFVIPSQSSLIPAKKRKSLFAQKLEGDCSVLRTAQEEIIKNNIPADDKNENVDYAIKTEVHKENLRKLENMSVDEIIEEKRNLEASLKPELLKFLKSRRAKANSVLKEENSVGNAYASAEENLNSTKEKLLQYLDKEWVEMSRIEPEKLEWVGDIPDTSTPHENGFYNARFDLNGQLQPFKHATIDVRTALYHHGEEPDRPGYTLDELVTLAQSTPRQMRMRGLSAIAAVIRSAKRGRYDSCCPSLLAMLTSRADLFLLIRAALDDRAVHSAAILALYHLICNPADETALDLLYHLPNCREPLLSVDLEMDKDVAESEIIDNEIIRQDLIRGLIRTDVLTRLTYILQCFNPDGSAVEKILNIFIRVARHSPEACRYIIRNSKVLIDLIFEFHLKQPLGIKLLRVLANTCPDLIPFDPYDLKFLFENLELNEESKDVYWLKLETIRMLQVFIEHGFLRDNLQSYFPNLIRILWFYLEKVDVRGSRLDFELYSAILSLGQTLSRYQVVDQEFYNIVNLCLKKWMALLTDLNFSLAKALGLSLQLLKSSILPNVDCFLPFSKTLISQSHMLHNAEQVTRDPPNLPSLCAIYKNGENYLKIVQENSSLPLFLGLIQCKINFELFSENFKKYFDEILKTPSVPSWFNKYETDFLVHMCEVVHFPADRLCKLLTYVRKDDMGNIIKLIKLIFNSFPSEFHPMRDAYIKYFKKSFSDQIPNYNCEYVPVEWLYCILPDNPKMVLKFISYLIMSDNKGCVENIPVTLKYFQLCYLFLTEENIFAENFRACVKSTLEDILQNFEQIDLNVKMSPEKSFYEFYTELLIHYSGTSYGDRYFAQIIVLPLANRFDISYRKLVWSEYLQVVQVLTLPDDGDLSLDLFVDLLETDESLLTIYVDAILRKVVNPTRNPFVFRLVVENLRNYLKADDRDLKLAAFLEKKIDMLSDINLKNYLLGINN